MRRSAAVGAMVWLTLSACSTAGDTSANKSDVTPNAARASTTQPELGTTTATSVPIPDGTAPLLTVGTFGAHPAIWLPRDLHSAVLYPDGTLLRVEVLRPGAVTLHSTVLPKGAIEELLVLADRSGLGDAARLPVESSPYEVVDGAWTVVTRRTDKGFAWVIADQLGAEGTPASSERRGALSELVNLLPGTDVSTWKTIEVERWAIESALPLADLATVVWPWPDIDPAGLDWHVADTGIQCAIVEDRDWLYSTDESQDAAALTSGIFRRPLLPHESSCDDVFSWRTSLDMADSMVLTPDGVRPS